MRIPKYRRGKPGMIAGSGIPQPVRDEMAEVVMYVGSPEHKAGPSFAGSPAPRADATICDPCFSNRQDMLSDWLRSAIRSGMFSEIPEGERYPRYAWFRHEGRVYMARLVNREQGHYKGWELQAAEFPDGV